MATLDRDRLYSEIRRVIEATGVLLSGHSEVKMVELVEAVMQDDQDADSDQPEREILLYSDGTIKRAGEEER